VRGCTPPGATPNAGTDLRRCAEHGKVENVGNGVRTVHVLVAAAALASSACARVTQVNDDAPSDGDAGDAPAAGDAGPAPAPDGAQPDASSEPTNPPSRPRDPATALPTRPIGEAAPLGEQLSFAFKAGYHDQEQIWLRGEGGALRRISNWTTDPPYTDTCAVGWSTLGYVGGRFGPLYLDASGTYLLFTESLACNTTRQKFPSRVYAHDLVSGTTRRLLETGSRPTIVASEQTAVVVVEHLSAADPPPPLAPGDVELFEFQGDALFPIEVPQVDDAPVRGLSNPQLLSWTDRVLLLVPGLPALERVGGTWQVSRVMDALEGAEISVIAASPSKTQLCAATSLVLPAGGREDSVGWVLDARGEWLSSRLAGAGWVQTCTWAPDETTVAFGSLFYDVETDRLVSRPFPTWRTTALRGTWRGALYGTDTENRTIVRVDWDTRTPETVLASEAFAGLCPAAGTPQLRLPPDDRALAIVKSSCGCIDCDVSGSVAWNAETSALTTIEEVFGEHQVYGVAWLADGGAAVLSTQGMGGGFGDTSGARPAPGAFFLVGADGAVDTVGPLPGVQGVLHSPRAPRGR
jgi:hypothetical protein